MMPDILTIEDALRMAYTAAGLRCLDGKLTGPDLHNQAFMETQIDVFCRLYHVDRSALQQPIGVAFTEQNE